jgi:hypothetical protein
MKSVYSRSFCANILQSGRYDPEDFKQEPEPVQTGLYGKGGKNRKIKENKGNFRH